MRFGWLYDAHRALVDCEACLALIAQELPVSRRRVMSAMRETALLEEHLVLAVDAPYDLRLKLKERGYRWHPPELASGNAWWTIAADPEVEIAWLRSEIYRHDASIPTRKVTAMNRSSGRLW